jgi:hypothetical protein
MSSVEPFLLDPANRAFLAGPPSRRRLVLQTWLGLLFRLSLLGVCLVLVGWAVVEWSRWLLLQRDYTIVSAEVVQCRKDDRTDGSPSYLITYRFEAATPTGPRTCTREQAVSWKTYARLHPGQRVSVRYSNALPSISSITADTSFRDGISLGALLWLPVALFLGSRAWGCYREIRLGQAGQVLEGRLLDCTSQVDPEDNLRLELQYRFTAPTGRVIRDRETSYRRDQKSALLPDPDTPVAVLYLDERTYKVL